MELEYEQIEYLQNLETINEKKDWLQNIHCLPNWLKTKKAYIEWCTGTGKTMALCKIAKHCENIFPEWTTYVIVPTTVLKEQFESTLQLIGVKNATVYVINTYTSMIARGVKMKCNLLIGDELHSMTGINSMFFSTVIPQTEFDTFAGGSATLEKQHVQFLKNYGITCCSKFTLQDSQTVGLSPPYTVYNIPVELTLEEQLAYIQADNSYWDVVNYFEKVVGKDVYSLIAGILTGKRGCKFRGIYYRTGTDLAQWFANEKNKLEGLNLKAGFIFNKALLFRQATSERRDILNNAQNLTEETIEFLNSVNERALVFCERTASCNEIASRTNSVEYHSGIKSAKTKKENLKKFLNSENVHMISCKSLQAGFDDSNVRIAIKHSYTSKALNAQQSVGRTLRITEKNKDFKVVIFINFYVQDFEFMEKMYYSQQKKWLQKAFKGMPNVEWVESIKNVVV